jgi:hypothetical protein
VPTPTNDRRFATGIWPLLALDLIRPLIDLGDLEVSRATRMFRAMASTASDTIHGFGPFSERLSMNRGTSQDCSHIGNQTRQRLFNYPEHPSSECSSSRGP